MCVLITLARFGGILINMYQHTHPLSKLWDISSTLWRQPRCKTLILGITANLLASAGFSQTAVNRAGSSLSLQVPPHAMSAVSFKAMPNAQCSVRPEGADSSVPSMTVYANDEGIATFYVEPSQASDTAAHLIATCSSGTAQTITIQPVTGAKPLIAPREKSMAANRQGQIAKNMRPALSGDPTLLSNAELFRHGYPMRPDPNHSPSAYAAWLKAVSKPAQFVSPKLVNVPGRFHGPIKKENTPAGSSNWSGYALYGGPSPFDWVEGEWYVPTTYGGESNTTVYSSLWIGLDGWGSDNVVQDGTEEDVTVWDFLFFKITSRTYYPWKEICCQEPEVVLSNFNVNPGDEIFSEVWMGDAYGNLDPNGGYGYFWFEDVSTGQYAYLSTPFSSGTFTGSSAEWVMERPTIGGNLPDLADYSYAYMLYPYAYRADGVYRNYLDTSDVTSEQITMYNGSNSLSTVVPIDSNTMEFFWLGYH